MSSGKKWSGELTNVRKNGETYWISASWSPVFDDFNKITNFVGVINDITEHKMLDDKLEEYRKSLEEKLDMRMIDLEESQKAAVFAMSKLTEARDNDTGHHIERVQYLCKALASKLRDNRKFVNQITPAYVNNIYFASALHDIGKIKIKDDILLKPSKLTEDEFEIMKNHVKYGADTLSEILRLFPNNNIILMGAKIAKYHHERWDGN